MFLSVDIRCHHAERDDLGPFCCVNTLNQVIFLVFVHKEADCAPVHPIDGFGIPEAAAQRIQHRAISTKRDNHIGIGLAVLSVALDERGQGGLGFGALGSEKGKFECTHRAHVVEVPQRRQGVALHVVFQL
jgi:hypothetical protein